MSVADTVDFSPPGTAHPDTHAERVSYLRAGHTLRSWLFTTDHKRIAILYLVTVTAFFFIGSVAAAMIRLELLTPKGDLLTNDGYNRTFTLHGVIMVWFFLIPSIPTIFGNFLLPLMIGARDLAFPRLNLASWYVYILGGMFTLYALIAGGVDTGWTFYTPLSSTFANGHVMAVLAAIVVVGFSSIFTGLNFIVTVHTLRAPGMTWGRLPLFVWSHYATSLILVLATPVLTITLILVAAERFFGIGIFDPELGGDPLLFQHLFWFYSHPAVYIMVLPGIGVVSELVTAAARKRIFGYWFVAYSSIAIAVIGFLVWGHHGVRARRFRRPDRVRRRRASTPDAGRTRRIDHGDDRGRPPGRRRPRRRHRARRSAGRRCGDARRRHRPRRRHHHPLHVGHDRQPEGCGVDPSCRVERVDGVRRTRRGQRAPRTDIAGRIE